MAQIHENPTNDAAVSSANPSLITTSLYIGDLDHDINDSQLYNLFNQVGHVVSVRVCRDLASQQSLGYGYVNFSNPHDAAKALDVLNFTSLNGKAIRIMHSLQDPSAGKSSSANVFIKNLDKTIDHKALCNTFSAFGNILSCKIAMDASGQSKGHGFVQFESEEFAQNAIDKLNGMLINDKQVYVGHFLRKQDRESALSGAQFNNVYVKNLLESTTNDDLKRIFGEHGAITSVVVMRDVDGKSKCFGFVNFANPGDAAKAVEALNGKNFDGKEWYVGRAQKKSERELELKGRRHEQSTKDGVDKYQGANLYIKNLDDSVGDEKLKELFSEFGAITSCKVMQDPQGISKGYGFVAFSTPEEATQALGEMNGKMVANKPLYVALAQRKEERRARLQAQFSQMRPVAIAPSGAPRMPLYPLGTPGIGQFLYGQTPLAIIPQAGFGYQQHLVLGMRPSGAPMPNFYVPLVQLGQQGLHLGGHQGEGPMHQLQQPLPLMQQQMLPWGHIYRYPPGSNLPNIQLAGVAGGMVAVPYGMVGQPMLIQALAMALTNATPEQKRSMLGEALYPLVDKLEHDAAAKVTGMLLEMDQHEVLHLIESPDALKAKVAEAMEVLRKVTQQQSGSPADQPASVSLNDDLES
ncbi:Polyadenylate-binding protein 8 [Spatholobus suberectus]|nr:Polyadenylate-binding protein 8 [Spatholobus suberectus]